MKYKSYTYIIQESIVPASLFHSFPPPLSSLQSGLLDLAASRTLVVFCAELCPVINYVS